MSKKKIKYKLEIGYKPLSDFVPHALKEFHEIRSNPNAQKLLIQTNLFYLTYGQVPPIEYFQFVLKDLNLTYEQYERGIKYLASKDWFSVVIRDRKVSYSLTDKFTKTFYHKEWRLYEQEKTTAA